MHGGDPLSEFGAGDGERWFGGQGGSAAESHAQKRPFEDPAGAGQAPEKFFLPADSVDQQRAGFRSSDLIDQGECLIRRTRKQGSDMPGFAAISDQRHRIAVRQ
jgi:hypothetical protein